MVNNSTSKRKLLTTAALVASLTAAGTTLAHGPMMGGYGDDDDLPRAQGYGYGMGPGMMGYGCPNADQDGAAKTELKTDDVKKMMESRLAFMRNPNLKVGKVAEKDKDTISAEIVTKDGSLVRGFEVNRHTGWMRPVK